MEGGAAWKELLGFVNQQPVSMLAIFAKELIVVKN